MSAGTDATIELRIAVHPVNTGKDLLGFDSNVPYGIVFTIAAVAAFRFEIPLPKIAQDIGTQATGGMAIVDHVLQLDMLHSFPFRGEAVFNQILLNMYIPGTIEQDAIRRLTSRPARPAS